uniref:Uncharacterized protein n=1 Tax=Salix viminalis TaxID=40686 RepID=A0A6N2NET2_SALVM
MAPGLRIEAEEEETVLENHFLTTRMARTLCMCYLESPLSSATGPLNPKALKVVWLSDVDRTKGYSVDFLSLSLHAVSREPEAYSSPCIYTQIEAGDESEDSDSECNDALDFVEMDTLFQILCECAELNPEPIKDNEEHNWIFSADQLVDEFAEVKRLLQSTTSGNVSLLFVSKTEVQVFNLLMELASSDAIGQESI